MLDETLVTETPPLYSCYGRRGEQVRVPISGNRAKRVIHGALNIRTGAVLLLITEGWDQLTHQYFLHMIRAYWRGWHIVLFEDRGSPHTADDSWALAAELQIQVRFLPVATPELNAMDHLWRHVKRDVLANRPTCSTIPQLMSPVSTCLTSARNNASKRPASCRAISGWNSATSL